MVNPLVSVVVCSRRAEKDPRHLRNIEKTVECPFEYIHIDNHSGRYSLASAYNEGVSRALGEVVAFVHEDVFFMLPRWGLVLQQKFQDPKVGLVGVAGTQFLRAEVPACKSSGRPFIKGRVLHETNNGSAYFKTAYSVDPIDSEVVAVDGLFFAVRRSLFPGVGFDAETFNHFHFYDLDICMQIRRASMLIVTFDILVKHLSTGSFDQKWMEYALRFKRKYQAELPAFCVDTKPDSNAYVDCENIDLAGRLPQYTIC